MIKYILSRKASERGLIGIGFCIFLFGFGYFVLEYISIKENPPLGNTIYILIGSTFIFTSILGFVVILKYLNDYRKKKERHERKRRKHKLFYLKDSKEKDEIIK